MKQWWVQIFIIPNLRSLAAWLRLKDENSTGADDEAAEAIDHVLERLELWLAQSGGA
jgi:ABC-type cobalt transport system substrate-binding protein